VLKDWSWNNFYLDILIIIIFSSEILVLNVDTFFLYIGRSKLASVPTGAAVAAPAAAGAAAPAAAEEKGEFLPYLINLFYHGIVNIYLIFLLL